MAVNAAALALIKSAEGFVDHWYPDPAHGWKVPTVGYGHTDAAGEPKYAATKGKRFTEAEASAILLIDLEAYENDVRDLVKVPTNENQHGALTSFTFNLGKGNLAKSTLLKKLNRGDYAGAAKEFGKWVNAAGKPLPGLVKRREAERLLFLKPVATGAAPRPIENRPGAAVPQTRKSPLAVIAGFIIAILAAGYAYLRSKGLVP
jgi:lysozyme